MSIKMLLKRFNDKALRGVVFIKFDKMFGQLHLKREVVIHLLALLMPAAIYPLTALIFDNLVHQLVESLILQAVQRLFVHTPAPYASPAEYPATIARHGYG